jgi:hypothetical protein
MPWIGLGLCVVVLGSWLQRLPASAQPVDLDVYFYPIYEATYRRLAEGILPLWNPYQLCGIPWLGTLQGGFFFPLHAFHLVLPLHVALALSHVVVLVLLTLSTLAFARRAGLSAAAAALAVLLVGLRGMLVLSLASPNYPEAAVWLPLGALAVLGLARAVTPGAVALLAASTALSFLAGYPQPTVYLLYTWGSLLVALLLGERAAPARWVASLSAFAAGIAIGVLGAGVQLAPALELVRNGVHADLSPEAMAPMSPALGVLRSAVAGGPFSWGVLALALGAAAGLSRRHRTLGVWALAMTLITVVFALGRLTPLFELYRSLPFLGSFRFPDRVLGMTDFVFAIAAGVGLDAVRERWPAARAGRLGAAVGLLAVVLVGIELARIPWRHMLTYADVVPRYRRHEAAYRALAARAGHDRVWVHAELAGLLPEMAVKQATRHRVRALDDYEPLAPRRQAEYLTFFTEGTSRYHRPPWLFAGSPGALEPPPGVAPPAARRRLLDLAAVRWIVLPAHLSSIRPPLNALVTEAGFVPRALGDDALVLLENPRAMPRAFVVYRTRPAPPTDALLAAMSADTFDPLAESYVEGDVALAPSPEAPVRGDVARFVRDDERVVEVEALLTHPGLVVLADAFYPGWRAFVDGRPAPVVATNHLFRGVAAPAGTHRIRFEYRPASVAQGAAASALGWSAIAVLALVSARRRARRAGTPG